MTYGHYFYIFAVGYQYMFVIFALGQLVTGICLFSTELK
jgi:hypothetical protein